MSTEEAINYDFMPPFSASRGGSFDPNRFGVVLNFRRDTRDDDAPRNTTSTRDYLDEQALETAFLIVDADPSTTVWVAAGQLVVKSYLTDLEAHDYFANLNIPFGD